MTGQKLLQVAMDLVNLCLRHHPGVEPLKCNSKAVMLHEGAERAVAAHLHYMLMQLPELLERGKVEKAMRWLGFMQGAVWARGMLPLDEIKWMSMPDDERLALERIDPVEVEFRKGDGGGGPT